VKAALENSICTTVVSKRLIWRNQDIGIGPEHRREQDEEDRQRDADMTRIAGDDDAEQPEGTPAQRCQRTCSLRISTDITVTIRGVAK
jgi:hypothetical protein